MTAKRTAWRQDDLIAVFMTHRPRLIKTANRILGCRCLAEDMVQETMLKICENGVDEDVQSPAAYMFRMVRNLSIDCARRRARERGLAELEEDGTQLAAPCPCPETTMARCQALRIVMSALQELPERTSHAFQMHRIEGVSQRDIASQLHVSPTLVNFMVRDAHNHCRSKLLSHKIDSELVPAVAGRTPGATGKPSSGANSAAGRNRRRVALERT